MPPGAGVPDSFAENNGLGFHSSPEICRTRLSGSESRVAPAPGPAEKSLLLAWLRGPSTEQRQTGSNTAQVGMGECGQRCPPQLPTDLPGAWHESHSWASGGGSLGPRPPTAADKPLPDASSSDISCCNWGPRQKSLLLHQRAIKSLNPWGWPGWPRALQHQPAPRDSLAHLQCPWHPLFHRGRHVWAACGGRCGQGFVFLSTQECAMPAYVSPWGCALVLRDDYGQMQTFYTIFNLKESHEVLLSSPSPFSR